jgi:glycosyl hydrolase family 18 (putative chitinase)
MRTTRVLAGFALIATVLAAAPPTALAATIPAHVYSPYFETWTTDSLATTAQQSGAKFFTMAFLETLSKTSCTLAWNGDKARTIGSGAYAQDIADLRALGGDVIPSFGGWSADQGGTEIGDSCKNVDSIAAAYQGVVTTYNVTRLDMDIEGRSLTKTDGIDRRNKAIKKLQDWAVAQGRTLTISYTLPTNRNGLPSSSLFVLQNAVSNGVRIDYVTPMVFDYYDRANQDMGQSAISAVTGLHGQLQTLLPSKTSAQIWAIEGAIIMNGLDDYPRRTESTSVQDAIELRDFAIANGMSILSMWAIQRDHGGCDGVTGANNCSGIPQADWEFTSNLKGFTGP